MNNVKRYALLIWCFMLVLSLSAASFIAASAGKGSEPGYIFYKGNALYEEEDYDGAIAEYTKLLDKGLESGNLYFNIGNSYFKKGETGRAILYYERARRLIPKDGDLDANESYARSLIMGSESEGSKTWKELIVGVFDVFTIDGLTVFLSALYAGFLLFLLAGLFLRSLKRFNRFVLPVLLIIFVLGTLSLYHRTSVLDKEAVIISESVDAKFEPLDSATAYFNLHEGMKVNVVETKRDWSKVERFDGKAGWITSDSMERI